MKYTVQLDFFIDEDEVRTDEEVKEVVREIFDYSNCSASNIKVIDVNDWYWLNSRFIGKREVDMEENNRQEVMIRASNNSCLTKDMLTNTWYLKGITYEIKGFMWASQYSL